MSLNLYAQVNDRTAEVMKEIGAQERDDVPDSTRTQHGGFDHTKWLHAELESLSEERERLMDAVTVEGAVNYEDS